MAEREIESHLESDSSVPQPDAKLTPREGAGWLRVGLIAATSALVGGMAAAWYYRKTLERLRQSDQNGHNPDFRISSDDPADDV